MITYRYANSHGDFDNTLYIRLFIKIVIMKQTFTFEQKPSFNCAPEFHQTLHLRTVFNFMTCIFRTQVSRDVTCTMLKRVGCTSRFHRSMLVLYTYLFSLQTGTSDPSAAQGGKASKGTLLSYLTSTKTRICTPATKSGNGTRPCFDMIPLT